MAERNGERASIAQKASESVGVVLGSIDATPLEFWIG
jgi:hypothetical protein